MATARSTSVTDLAYERPAPTEPEWWTAQVDYTNRAVVAAAWAGVTPSWTVLIPTALPWPTDAAPPLVPISAVLGDEPADLAGLLHEEW